MIKIWDIIISSLSFIVLSWIALKWFDCVYGEEDDE